EAEWEYRRALALQAQLAADFPAVPDYAVDLGGSYCNLGNLLRQRGAAAASLDWYAKGLAMLRPVLAQHPQLVRARLFLRNTHWGRAWALGQLSLHAEAITDWEQALDLNDVQQQDAILRLGQAVALARAGQQAEGTVAVEDVLKPGNADRGTLYDAAC